MTDSATRLFARVPYPRTIRRVSYLDLASYQSVESNVCSSMRTGP